MHNRRNENLGGKRYRGAEEMTLDRDSILFVACYLHVLLPKFLLPCAEDQIRRLNLTSFEGEGLFWGQTLTRFWHQEGKKGGICTYVGPCIENEECCWIWHQSSQKMWMVFGSMLRIRVRGRVKVRVGLSCRTTVRVGISGGVSVDTNVRYRRWCY